MLCRLRGRRRGVIKGYAEEKDPLSCVKKYNERVIFMTITKIKFRKVFADGTLRAVVSVTIDDSIAIHEIKVIKGSERLFIAMPSRKDENGIYRDVIHPIYPEARKYFEDTILEAYDNYLKIENVMNSEADNMSL